MELDRTDIALLAGLTANARASHVELADTIGLSSTAIARRQKMLEEMGLILGYNVALDFGLLGLRTTVIVRISLESQSDDALRSFEKGVVSCPSIMRCYLMSGSDDYLAIVLVKDMEDFERIHRMELSRLPRVSRIQSNFALREIVNRTAPPTIFSVLNARKR